MDRSRYVPIKVFSDVARNMVLFVLRISFQTVSLQSER